MAWPKNLNQVQCRKFNRALLPLIKNDIESNTVKFYGSRLIGEVGDALFKWNGSTFEIWEQTELVYQICCRDPERLKTTPEITHALLSYKEYK